MPVSAKIRLLGSPSETVEFARRMEKAGACALTVHVRSGLICAVALNELSTVLLQYHYARKHKDHFDQI